MEPSAPSDYYLAIDQGGHASRARLFDTKGHLIVEASRKIRTLHPSPYFVEHDPDELVSSVYHVIQRCLSDAHKQGITVSTAGLATQRSSIICWDKTTGAPLSNVISWQDRRAASWLRQFKEQQQYIHKITGLYPSPHYGVSKINWCLTNIPKVSVAHQEQRLIISPLASYLCHHLCTEQTIYSDPCNGSRTLLMNIKTNDWDDNLINIFNVPRCILPKLVPNKFDFGTIKTHQHTLPLTVVTGDQSAMPFHNGYPNKRAAYINIGTGAFIQRMIDEPTDSVSPLLSSIIYRDDQHCYYALEGTVNGAGSALSWFESEITKNSTWKTHFDFWLSAPSPSLYFINTVGGLASPYWLSQLSPRFIGEGSTSEQFCAVVESILFLIYKNLQTMEHQLEPASELILSGGLAVSDALCQRLADLSQTHVLRPKEKEATARGLCFLINSSKPHWKPSHSDQFKFKTDEALQQRYKQWCSHMQHVVNSYTV